MPPQARIDPLLLEKVLSSPPFARSERICDFLRLLADQTNRADRLKEVEIGARVFGRPIGYDPKIDSIVRVEATRLRRKLREYYLSEGRNDAWQISVPPGRYELELLPAQAAVAPPEAPPAAHPKPWLRWIAVAVVVIGAVLVGTWRIRPGSLPEAAPLTFLPGVENYPSFSPVGDRFAFTWTGENHGIPAVYAERLNGEDFRRITQSSLPEYFPVWSPDGRYLAFLRKPSADRLELRTVGVDGAGDALLASLAALPSTMPGLSWSRDGEWLATAESTGVGDAFRLLVISRRTGEKRLFREGDSRTGYMYPAFSPDGRSLAFIKAPDVGVNDVFVAGFPDGPERQVTANKAIVRGLAWSSPDELVISTTMGGRQETLWRTSLSGGQPVRLTDGVLAALYPATSFDGRKLIFSRRTDDVNLWRRSLADDAATDAGQPWIAATGLDSSPQFSPDGTRLAFRSSRTGQNEIWVAENDGRTARRITQIGGPLTGSPHWSPDGMMLAFDSRAAGNSDIWIVASGGGTPRALTTDASNEVVPGWSRDGKYIYYSSDRAGAWSVWRKPAGGGVAELVRERAFAAAESADARYLYYVHGPNDAGLYRAPVAGGDEETVIAGLHPGMWGNWAFGGSGIYFIDWIGEGAQMEAWAQYRADSGEIRRLFRLQQPVGWDGGLAVSPDGRWLVYAQLDRIGCDIFEMRNWK